MKATEMIQMVIAALKKYDIQLELIKGRKQVIAALQKYGIGYAPEADAAQATLAGPMNIIKKKEDDEIEPGFFDAHFFFRPNKVISFMFVYSVPMDTNYARQQIALANLFLQIRDEQWSTIKMGTLKRQSDLLCIIGGIDSTRKKPLSAEQCQKEIDNIFKGIDMAFHLRHFFQPETIPDAQTAEALSV